MLTQAELRVRLVDRILYSMDTPPQYLREMTISLHRYSTEMLKQLVLIFEEDRKSSKDIKISVRKHCSEETLREHIAFFPMLPDYDYNYLFDVVSSLRFYRQLPVTNDFTSEGDEVINQCKAILRMQEMYPSGISETLFEDDNPIKKIANSDLVDLLVSRAEDIDLIMLLMRERKTFNPDIIREMLDLKTVSLSNGVL